MAVEVEMEDYDFCAAVLSKFTNSSNEHHQHVCTSIGAMSQELKDQNHPLTPIAYFGATCSSLHRLATAADPYPPGHLIDALATILSLVLSKINSAILKNKFNYLSDLLSKILHLKSIGQNGVVSTLKCVSRLLIVRDKVQWSDVAELYGVLLRYITDDRLKVRKQSHICLREVLQYFQMSPALGLLGPASDAITNVFERFLSLAGGSNDNASEGSSGSKGAHEVLYILDALKLILPSMSMKSSTDILKRFKSLLVLKQPVVNRRITDALSALCILPGGDISPEVLLDLLCSLASSISANDTSADSMTFIARLLDLGMKRVYNLNKQICVVKLPLIFTALTEILASEHEESLLAAMGALKSLIDSCIDENLISKGVEQVTNSGTRKTGPTIIEKLCVTVESLLGYHYTAIWDMSFQVVSSMFDKLGQNSTYFLKGTLKSLADMQKLPDEDFSFRKQLHECVGSALGAMGPEIFLEILPLNLENEDLSKANLWLFPILKQYIVGARLSFFTESILPIIKEMKHKSKMLEQEGLTYSGRSVDGIVYSLWSLLPSFCNYPSDTAKSFNNLEKHLCNALREEQSGVQGIICSSLQILIHQNKNIIQGINDVSDTERNVSEERAIAQYNPEIATQNLNVLKSSSARKLLSDLSSVFLSSSKDTLGPLQSTIGELASISDRNVVAKFYNTLMQKLLNVTLKAKNVKKSTNSDSMQDDNESSIYTEWAALLDLAVSLLPGLDAKEIETLFSAVKPALKDDEGLIQKKAYKVLSIIIRQSEELNSKRLEDLLELMIELMPSYHLSAKRHRLDCLYYLIVHASKNDLEKRMHYIISSFLTEVILALKEVNKKTRNRAYEVLVQIGHACADIESEESLPLFFRKVAGGLTSDTPHMVSAAVKGLARLAYEFSELVSEGYNLLPSAFLLLQRKNKEIIKANLGLLKVLVAKSQGENLQSHLKNMVESLLNWQDSTKSHFKAKIKLLIEMLVKKCGMDAVKSVMPEEHMKLLTNIRKLKERKDRKLASNFEESKSQLTKATTSRLSRWNHTKIFSEFGDEETEVSEADYMNGETVSGRQSKVSKPSTLRSKKMRKAAKSLQEDVFDQLDDEPLDLLDKQRTRSSLRSSDQLKRKHESDDELEFDSEGRLIITEGERKTKRNDTDMDNKSEAESTQFGGSQKGQKRRKKSENGWAFTGKEYKSKKASGDVMKKGKLEPFAYWPLDRKMVSRRPEHRAAARKGMASVVKITKSLEGKSVSNALSAHAMRFKKNKRKNK